MCFSCLVVRPGATDLDRDEVVDGGVGGAFLAGRTLGCARLVEVQVVGTAVLLGVDSLGDRFGSVSLDILKGIVGFLSDGAAVAVGCGVSLVRGEGTVGDGLWWTVAADRTVEGFSPPVRFCACLL